MVCVGGNYQLIDVAGRYLITLTMPKANKEIQALHLRGHCALLHPSAMMRSDAVRLIGNYHTTFSTATDMDLWLRLGEVGEVGELGELVNIDNVILKYRLHDKSTSERAGLAQRKRGLRAC